MQMTEIGFLFVSTIFFSFLVFISAQMGTSIITGFNPQYQIALTGIGPIDFITGIVNNLTIFTQLMFVSSDFAMINSVVITAYGICMGYLVLRLIRGGG